MALCIYTREDENTATFASAEHIFPACIGGIRCLPRGWVSDQFNNMLSRAELGFAREYPPIAISRMFSPAAGRKRHTGRDRIGVFQNTENGTDYMLGFIYNMKPFPIDQIIIPGTPPAGEDGSTYAVRVIAAPSSTRTNDEQIRSFWQKLREYNGSPTCIKDKKLPAKTYWLGCKDKRWYLGLNSEENPEIIKPKLQGLVQQVSSQDIEAALCGHSGPIKEEHHVVSSFQYSVNTKDYLRVSAKIAVNCLAFLKGRETVLSPAFTPLKEAIQTGKAIEEFVWQIEGPNPQMIAFAPYKERLSLGRQCHSAFFTQKEDWLYCLVSFYGFDNPTVVKMGKVPDYIGVDAFICDHENRAEYSLTDCAKKICRFGENETEEGD